MQRCENLVDLEKRCKMSIWTQKSALIQLRTSLLKFDDLAEKSEKSSVSNFSTNYLKVLFRLHGLHAHLESVQRTPCVHVSSLKAGSFGAMRALRMMLLAVLV